MRDPITPAQTRIEANRIRESILTRDGRRCVVCEATRTLVMHHIEYVIDGGKNDPANLTTLCRRCHVLVHRWRITPAHLRGLMEAVGWALPVADAMHDAEPPEPESDDLDIEAMFNDLSGFGGFYRGAVKPI